MAETIENLVSDLTGLEWELFQRVHNEGGQAYCQTQRDTFFIMRTSQLKTWPFPVLCSYEDDLLIALTQGRNLLAEKYAHMMQFTNPQRYGKLKDRLPKVNEDTMKQIDQLVALNLKWEELANDLYPALRKQGRPVSAADDTENVTSVETYLRGELMTYSSYTIRILLEHTLQAEEGGRNLVLENLKHIVRAYGYESLETAEEVLMGKGDGIFHG